MPTSTFDRKIEIKDPIFAEKLISIMEGEGPLKPLSEHPYTDEERERSVKLFRQCLARSEKVN